MTEFKPQSQPSNPEAALPAVTADASQTAAPVAAPPAVAADASQTAAPAAAPSAVAAAAPSQFFPAAPAAVPQFFPAAPGAAPPQFFPAAPYPSATSPEFQHAQFAPPPAFFTQPASTARPGRQYPLLGPAVWIASAFWWSYGVAGQFVIVTEFPEVLAVLAVALTVAFTTWLAVSESNTVLRQTLPMAPGVGLKPLWLGLLLAAFGIGVVALFARALRGGFDTLITFALAMGSVLPFYLGRRWTNPGRRWPQGMRLVLYICAALAAGLLTIVAVVAL